MKLTAELLAKAKEAKSAEDLVALAKAEGIALTEEEAKKYFTEWHKEGELADDELDNVSGGCGDPDPQYQVGNIVMEHSLTTMTSTLYEILSIGSYIESVNSWQYVCRELENNYEVTKTLDNNSKVQLHRWSRNEL